jgi:serine protease Do
MRMEILARDFICRRQTMQLLAGGVAYIVFLAEAAVCQAQIATTALERSGPLSPEKRAELRRVLDQHSAVLESQAVVLKTVAKLMGPSVVHIEADVPQQPSIGSGRERRVEESGSGVVVRWKEKDYVLTNWHVVRQAPPESVRVNLCDGRRLHPARVWTDSGTDVAVLQIEAQGLFGATLGDSDRLDSGDFVLALGSPFGLSRSVTLGIISGKGRRDLRMFGDESIRFQDFLQTDAAINPGNSGGPLCNVRAEVIGINTAIASNSGGSEGIGFAIPINMFMVIAKQLIETGKVTRAYLGVTLDGHFGPTVALEAGLPGLIGARIASITKDSPAEAAHLQPGDIILEFNRVAVEDDSHLINLVGLAPVGQEVPLTVFRGGKTQHMTLTLGDRSRFDPLQ